MSVPGLVGEWSLAMFLGSDCVVGLDLVKTAFGLCGGWVDFVCGVVG